MALEGRQYSWEEGGQADYGSAVSQVSPLESVWAGKGIFFG
jgi:hypothetical protein